MLLLTCWTPLKRFSLTNLYHLFIKSLQGWAVQEMNQDLTAFRWNAFSIQPSVCSLLWLHLPEKWPLIIHTIQSFSFGIILVTSSGEKLVTARDVLAAGCFYDVRCFSCRSLSEEIEQLGNTTSVNLTLDILSAQRHYPSMFNVTDFISLSLPYLHYLEELLGPL